jgi:two-component system, LytTR family, response regulator
MISAILVDDEEPCLDSLNILLDRYCPEVHVAGRCTSGKMALESIAQIRPDLVFLDIEMPRMNGFELLAQFNQINFSFIFTTGHDQYAIQAFHFSALDYLLKPIDSKDLIVAVNKLKSLRSLPSMEQLQMLMDYVQHKQSAFTKIAIPIVEGYELIPTDQVIRCEADDNYTHFYLKNKKKITACRTLKEISEQLEPFTSFVRVHNSHIVNLNEVTKYFRGEGGYLVMNDGSTVNVSRGRKDLLLSKIRPDKE